MSATEIRFVDGAAYDLGMGVWSRIAADQFLDWLAPAAGLRWVDVGCGTGAFTERLFARCEPVSIHGIDPSDSQLAFARANPPTRQGVFQQGDAMALPYPDDSFDAAAMALVIFFVPDPAKGVAEMARVVRPGGLVAAYAWDMLGGGFPFHPIQAELRTLGIIPPYPPSVDSSRMEALRTLWTEAGLRDVELREITVERGFSDFDEFWRVSTGTGSLKPTVAALTAEQLAALKARVAARLPRPDASGRIAYSARANAVKGRVAG